MEENTEEFYEPVHWSSLDFIFRLNPLFEIHTMDKGIGRKCGEKTLDQSLVAMLSIIVYGKYHAKGFKNKHKLRQTLNLLAGDRFALLQIGRPGTQYKIRPQWERSRRFAEKMIKEEGIISLHSIFVGIKK